MDSSEENKKNKPIKMKLSLNEEVKDSASDFQKDYLKDEIDSLPPIREGELYFNGIYTYDMGDKIEVYFYVRNGFKAAAHLEDINFIIVNSKNEVLARQRFDMRGLGYIPSMSARPAKIYFDKANVFVDKIPKDDWKLGIASNAVTKKAVRIKLEDMPREYNSEQRDDLLKFAEELPSLKRDETDISPYRVTVGEGYSLILTFLIRNAKSEVFKVNNMYLELLDGNDEAIVKGKFDLTKANIVVNPESGKLYNFVFKKESFLKKNFSLNNCDVVVKYNY